MIIGVFLDNVNVNWVMFGRGITIFTFTPNLKIKLYESNCLMTVTATKLNDVD